ncbi:hypothetical protein GCM10010191_88730 [Actinomadura vinacea]|uniref:Uncharacterized protein n=1 Tax=Actinomadura vinacea TaxID=115336 RepID=A0ABP5XH26_9ACTN
MHQLVLRNGETFWTAALLPVSPDGMIVTSMMIYAWVDDDGTKQYATTGRSRPARGGRRHPPQQRPAVNPHRLPVGTMPVVGSKPGLWNRVFADEPAGKSNTLITSGATASDSSFTVVRPDPASFREERVPRSKLLL